MGDAGSGWQGQQQQQQLDDGLPSGLTEGNQQQPPPPSSLLVAAPSSVVKSPAANVPGQAQAAGAASALTDLAKQLLGEGGGNRDPGGGLFEGEEEDEAEGTFIAVEGCTPSNGGELHFVVERESSSQNLTVSCAFGL